MASQLDRRVAELERALPGKHVYEMSDTELLAAMGLPHDATDRQVAEYLRAQRPGTDDAREKRA